MKFAYADPPYFGNGKKYALMHEHALDWDDKQTHLDLIATLNRDYPDGWALSCNPKDLSFYYAACPDARVCNYTKDSSRRLMNESQSTPVAETDI